MDLVDSESSNKLLSVAGITSMKIVLCFQALASSLSAWRHQRSMEVLQRGSIHNSQMFHSDICLDIQARPDMVYLH